jgi:hypothetical protein
MNDRETKRNGASFLIAELIVRFLRVITGKVGLRFFAGRPWGLALRSLIYAVMFVAKTEAELRASIVEAKYLQG